MVLLPLAFAYVLCQPLSKLSQPDFQRKWGELYDGLKLRSKVEASFHLVYIVRRILYCFIAFLLYDFTVFQAQTLVFLNICNTIYAGNYLPRASKF